MSQRAFDPLGYQDQQGLGPREAARAARKERDRALRLLRRDHPDKEFKGWTLPDQLSKYAGFGRPDGRVRNVYYITAYDMAHGELELEIRRLMEVGDSR